MTAAQSIAIGTFAFTVYVAGLAGIVVLLLTQDTNRPDTIVSVLAVRMTATARNLVAAFSELTASTDRATEAQRRLSTAFWGE